MDAPWWAWVLIAAYAAPGVYFTYVLLTMTPIPLLTEEGKLPTSPPLWRKVLVSPVILVIIVVAWPTILWSEYRHMRRSEVGRRS